LEVKTLNSNIGVEMSDTKFRDIEIQLDSLQKRIELGELLKGEVFKYASDLADKLGIERPKTEGTDWLEKKEWLDNFRLILGICERKYFLVSFGTNLAKKILLISSVVILLSGGILELYFGNNLFERFGSLLVCTSLIYMFFHTQSVLPHLFSHAKNTVNSESFITTDIKKMPIVDQQFESYLRTESLKKYKHYEQIALIKLLKFEVTLVIIGTLVNGFGSLLINIFV